MPKRRLQDELIKLGLADNTVVSLIGDHGQHVAEKKPFEKDDQLCESVGGSVGELVGKLFGGTVVGASAITLVVGLAGGLVGDNVDGRLVMSQDTLPSPFPVASLTQCFLAPSMLPLRVAGVYFCVLRLKMSTFVAAV